MAYPYGARLSRKARAAVEHSDQVPALPLRDAATLAPHVAAVARALAQEDRGAVQRAVRALVDALCIDLRVAPVIVRVLARRPSNATSELHGLYERVPGETAVIRVWMRTSTHERVVAFRTFLRTLLHEVCHHVDFETLKLWDSFHTKGFFRRESSLVRQLAGPGRGRARGSATPATVDAPPVEATRSVRKAATKPPAERPPPVDPRQLALF